MFYFYAKFMVMFLLPALNICASTIKSDPRILKVQQLAVSFLRNKIFKGKSIHILAFIA